MEGSMPVETYVNTAVTEAPVQVDGVAPVDIPTIPMIHGTFQQALGEQHAAQGTPEVNNDEISPEGPHGFLRRQSFPASNYKSRTGKSEGSSPTCCTRPQGFCPPLQAGISLCLLRWGFTFLRKLQSGALLKFSPVLRLNHIPLKMNELAGGSAGASTCKPPGPGLLVAVPVMRPAHGHVQRELSRWSPDQPSTRTA